MADKKKQFIKAYDDFGDAIFRYCYLRVLNSDAARDITQETFVRTWDYLVGGNEVKNFRPFLYRVASNLIIDESRKRKVVSLDILKEKGFDPRLDNREELYNIIDAKGAVMAAAKMDEKYRDVILMRYVDGLAVKEIAEIMQMPEDTISVRIHRGLEKLRIILNHGQES